MMIALKLTPQTPQRIPQVRREFEVFDTLARRFHVSEWRVDRCIVALSIDGRGIECLCHCMICPLYVVSCSATQSVPDHPSHHK